jgi:putative endonuclease
MTYLVYILYSEKFEKHYAGFTSDLDTRLRSHNEFGNDWSKDIVHGSLFSERILDKMQALSYEKWLKTGVGRDFIKKLPH